MILQVTSALVFACIQGQSQVQVPVSPSPGLVPGPRLVSMMLAKYHDAKTLTASIHMVQTALDKSLVFDTTLVYERPQKIYLTHRRSDDPTYAPVLVSDSVTFGYTVPPNLHSKLTGFLRETAHPPEGQMNIEEMWAAIKSQFSAADTSFALIAMISRKVDLKAAVPQLVTCENKGKVTLGNQVVNDIEGVWRNSGFRETGLYQMYITDSGDLVQQVLKMNFNMNQTWLYNHKLPLDSYQNMQVTTTWDVNAVVNQSVNESLFRVPEK